MHAPLRHFSPGLFAVLAYDPLGDEPVSCCIEMCMLFHRIHIIANAYVFVNTMIMLLMFFQS